MMNRHETNRLIHALRNLFFKVSHYDLLKRISAYRHKSASGVAPDISVPLSKHIDKLVDENKRTSSQVSHAVIKDSSIEHKFEKISSAGSQPSRVKKMLDGLARHYKRSAVKTGPSQHMGEKLKSSTWSHLHVASMEARRGNVAAARVHAGIANQALKEAAHYMSDDEYKAFSGEVAQVINNI